MTMDPEQGGLRAGDRVRVFIDFWNLQLSMRSAIGGRFDFDWQVLPGWLVRRAGEVCQTVGSYEGAHVYGSFGTASEQDRGLAKWATTWLDRQPGVQVNFKERRPRNPPSCPACHQLIPDCPHCGSGLARTQEKGIDTAIVTDMIRLAWEDGYDIAVLVSSDSDFVPVVEFLDLRGKKVVQAGFPPSGSHLARACWASFDLYGRRTEFERRSSR